MIVDKNGEIKEINNYVKKYYNWEIFESNLNFKNLIMLENIIDF